MNNKKLKTSKVIIGLYGRHRMFPYMRLYAIFNSITYLRNYFKTYGSSIENTSEMPFLSPKLVSVIHRICCSSIRSSSSSACEVRKLNPDNYL